MANDKVVKTPYIKLLFSIVLLGAAGCGDLTVPEEDVGLFEEVEVIVGTFEVEEVNSGIHFDKGMDETANTVRTVPRNASTTTVRGRTAARSWKGAATGRPTTRRRAALQGDAWPRKTFTWLGPVSTGYRSTAAITSLVNGSPALRRL